MPGDLLDRYGLKQLPVEDMPEYQDALIYPRGYHMTAGNRLSTIWHAGRPSKLSRNEQKGLFCPAFHRIRKLDFFWVLCHNSTESFCTGGAFLWLWI